LCGFESTPEAERPAAFRSLLRKDQAKSGCGFTRKAGQLLHATQTAGAGHGCRPAARYVSLADALGPPPSLDAPEHFDELPAGVLECWTLGRWCASFFKQSGIEGRLPAYLRAAQAESDRLRQPAAEMVRAVLSYLQHAADSVDE